MNPCIGPGRGPAAERYLDISDLDRFSTDGEHGLLGLAFDRTTRIPAALCAYNSAKRAAMRSRWSAPGMAP